MSAQLEAVVQRALDSLRAAGAEGDASLVESESLQVRVTDAEIDFVKQAHRKALALRAFVGGDGGSHQASSQTSDLSPEAIEHMVGETVALARATAPDPTAGLPDGGFADEIPDLELFDPAERT